MADGFNHPGNAGDYRTGLMGEPKFQLYFASTPNASPRHTYRVEFPGRRRPRQVPGRLPASAAVRPVSVYPDRGADSAQGVDNAACAVKFNSMKDQSGNPFTMTFSIT